MKFSEMMLNFATGDACQQDAYIQQSLGQINVSKSFYEAAVEIISLDADEMKYVQEAVAEAGLPSDRQEALVLAQEAYTRACKGLVDLVQRTNSKLAESADNNWKVICGAAKITGVSNEDMNSGLDTFAESFANNVAAKAAHDGTEMSKGFKDGTSLRTAAGVYMKAVQDVLPAFGVKGDKGSDMIREYVSLSDSDYTDGDMNKFITTMEYATAALNGSSIAPADGATRADLEDYVATAANLKSFCEGVAEALSSESVVNTAADYAAQYAGNGRRSQIAMEQMSIAANRIVAATNALHKALNDSGYAVGETINGGVAPLPTKQGE